MAKQEDWDVTVWFTGNVRVRVRAHSEDEAEDVARQLWDRGSVQITVSDCSLDTIQDAEVVKC